MRMGSYGHAYIHEAMHFGSLEEVDVLDYIHICKAMNIL